MIGGIREVMRQVNSDLELEQYTCIAQPPVILWPKYVCRECGVKFDSKLDFENHLVPF
jgi:hypothetical protein